MRQLTPIKVKIGTRRDGQADHPNFNQLSIVQASGLDWSKYVDIEGSGWLYDSCCGHKDEAPDSPYGMQWGVLLVPQQFADEALVQFPDLVEVIDEPTCKRFFEDHNTKDMPSEDIDTERLQAIKAKQDLGRALSVEDQDALDPATQTRGIRRNRRKFWDDYKSDRGYQIV